MSRIIGADGCRKGWCAVFIDDSGESAAVARTVVLSIDDLVASDGDLICLDIPIGLLNGPGKRACDVEARSLLKRPRASSVFPSPSRPALQFKGQNQYQAASDGNLRVAGKRLSKQTFCIMPKVAEVDSRMTPRLQARMKEVHPEVCFWALNGRRPMARSKKHPDGLNERWDVLRGVLPSLPQRPRLPVEIQGECALDDFVDALVAAYTSLCIRRDAAARIPRQPPADASGLQMEMWFPRTEAPAF